MSYVLSLDVSFGKFLAKESGRLVKNPWNLFQSALLLGITNGKKLINVLGILLNNLCEFDAFMVFNPSEFELKPRSLKQISKKTC